MELNNVFIENISYNTHGYPLTREKNYYRCIVSTNELNISDKTHIFSKIRYFNNEKKYIKTINIIQLNGVLLENQNFYVSFVPSTQYKYGLFSKKNLNFNDENPYKIGINGVPIQSIPEDLSDIENSYLIYYGKKFHETFPDYSFIGIDYNPSHTKRLELTAFINNKVNGNLTLAVDYVEMTRKNSSFKQPIDIRVYFKQCRSIKEDDE